MQPRLGPLPVISLRSLQEAASSMPSCCRVGPGLKWTYTWVSSGTPTLGPQNEGFPIAHYGGASHHQWRLVHLEPKLNVRNYAAFVSELCFARAVVYLYKNRMVVSVILHIQHSFSQTLPRLQSTGSGSSTSGSTGSNGNNRLKPKEVSFCVLIQPS